MSQRGGAVVVATTTILGDITRRSVCQGVTVRSLLAPGQDPHSIELSAREAAGLGDADLVVANGLNLEERFTDVLLDVRDRGTPVLFLGDQLDPLPFGASGESESRKGDGSGGAEELDPHVWMDPLRMRDAAELIARELQASTGIDHASCSREYVAELEQLDDDVDNLLAGVPGESRRIVTNHDSLGYFADRYGFEVVGTIIPGGATLAEPSARDIVELIAAAERAGVRAIFSDAAASPALAQIVAEETEPSVELVPLFTGSLGDPGSGAETYVGMIRTNAERISVALAEPR